MDPSKKQITYDKRRILGDNITFTRLAKAIIASSSAFITE
jgi:hypothetical protein